MNDINEEYIYIYIYNSEGILYRLNRKCENKVMKMAMNM